MTARNSTNTHHGDDLRPGGFLGRWADRAFERRQLASMDRRMLSDIGLTTSDRNRECRKPFWKA